MSSAADAPNYVTVYTSQLLLDSAAAAGTSTVRQRLDTLFRLDAARWLAAGDALPTADRLEQEVLDVSPPEADADGAGGRLLEASLAVRRGLRAAGQAADWPLVAGAIEALPAGYPLKSLWLHWRDLMLATGCTERWEALRRELATNLQRSGVPPSEALPALLGRLDLTRWRSEARLIDRARAVLAERLGLLVPGRLKPAALVTYGSAGGRFLLMLGDEAGGARTIHEAVERLSLQGRLHRARLFSRPVPEAAMWLRRTIEQARLAGEPGETALQQAVLALLGLARQHRAGHIIDEALTPLPSLARSDAEATMLVYSALARLACGQDWDSHHALQLGLRLVGRQPRHPLAYEPLVLAVRWAELVREEALAAQLAELCRRLSGAGQVVAEAEVARLHRRLGETDRGWQLLAAAWRLSLGLPPEGRAAGLIAVAGTLLAWEQPAAGLAVIARVVSAAAGSGAPDVPETVAAAGDLAAEPALLEELLAATPVPLPATVPATRVLLRAGATRLGAATWEASRREIDAIEEPSRRLRSLLGLVKMLLDGVDLDLRAAVARAVAAEATRILDRLRSDDPPPGAHGAGR